MNDMRLLLFKLLATGAICAGAIYPLLDPELREGLFAQLLARGLPLLSLLVAGFLLAVALYCRSLQRCLSLLQAQSRTAEPGSVWLMFLIPYNFIEDFFIVANVSNSLRAEARYNPRLRGLENFGMRSGHGWCAAQLVAFVPNWLGELATLVALLLWALHWRFIIRVNRLLSQRQPATAP
ncbi:hypothetical protein DID96_23895 [Burkholderia sp. Bp8963]|uniref:hypothetical protein n=1 Tax=Burkholderia sp. Bp8963 TaxID=2184547 RepID=UPI000F5A98AA|nr:hypothetical protein [Burkholderia sp. Bp8963]RQS66471.1 hypothetical protein DID96_23895 [Burkholderia sp. Bp8963]